MKYNKTMILIGRSAPYGVDAHIKQTPGGAQMNLSLNPDLQKRINDQVSSGKYSTPEDVVAAAIMALDQQEQVGDFEAGELDLLLAEGEQSIERDGTLDGDEAFRLRSQRRAQQRKSIK
jgi:antitoxin ParD1/3/4